MLRWRVLSAPPRSRANWELKGGTRGLSLQRLLTSGPKIVRLRNANGLDVRRENLVATDMREVANERYDKRCKEAQGNLEHNSSPKAATKMSLPVKSEPVSDPSSVFRSPSMKPAG